MVSTKLRPDQTNYGYGPDGHVRSVKTINGPSYTIHWDGDNILFTDAGSHFVRRNDGLRPR